MTEHVLKCWPSQFHAVRAGIKPFEFRKNDRDYKVGDTLVLREFIPPEDMPFGGQGEPGSYTGEIERREITYILSSGFGLPHGFAVLGIRASALTPVPPSINFPVPEDFARDKTEKSRAPPL